MRLSAVLASVQLTPTSGQSAATSGTHDRDTVVLPISIGAFLESDNFEDAVRKAISLGGDSDTLACMAGGIAQASFGGVPKVITSRVYEVIDNQLDSVIRKFTEEFDCHEDVAPK